MEATADDGRATAVDTVEVPEWRVLIDRQGGLRTVERALMVSIDMRQRRERWWCRLGCGCNACQLLALTATDTPWTVGFNPQNFSILDVASRWWVVRGGRRGVCGGWRVEVGGRSAVGSWRSAVGSRRSAVGGRRSAVAMRAHSIEVRRWGWVAGVVRRVV